MILLIPWGEVEKTYEAKLDSIVKEAELSGFRKGKAPKKMVEEKMDKTKLYEEVIKAVLPPAYAKAVKEHNLIPVSSPKVEVAEAKQGSDWKIKITVALKPKITMKDYKTKLREAKKGKTEIWTPGKGADEKKEPPKMSLDEMLKVVTDNTEIELSDILVTEEANRLLSNLLDQIQKLGMNVDQYMAAKNKTPESLRAEYAQQAVKNLTIEFALSEIADQEKITVTQDDLNKLIDKAEKPEDKEKLKKDSYYLAHLIRQQKTLDFLTNL